MDRRARQLIDALIDRVHTDWPTVAFVLRLPSGEQVMLPRHQEGMAECAPGHSRYFSDRVRPFCEVDPTPCHGGRCWATPLTPENDPSDIPVYVVDRRLGILTARKSARGHTSTAPPRGLPPNP